MSKTRIAQIAQNIVGAAAARGINLVITAFMVPLTLNSLAPSEYALLSMAISFSVLTGFADLGLGLAIVNYISAVVSKDTAIIAQEILSTVWCILLGIAVGGLIVVGLYFWYSSTRNTEISNSTLALSVAGFFIFLGLPAGLAQQILFAKQKSYIANVWATSGRVLSLIWVWQVVMLGYKSLFLLLVGVFGIPTLVAWLSLIWLSKSGLMDGLLLTRKYFSSSKAFPSTMTGLRYLILQVAPYIESGVDVLLLGYLVALEAVPPYDVYSKLFMYVVALSTMIVAPFWPALANARAAGEDRWVSKLVAYCIVGSPMLAFIVAATIGYWAQEIVRAWTGQNLEVTNSVLLGFIGFAILASLGVAQSAVLNSYGLVAVQAKYVGIYIISIILFKILGALMFGPVGMIWALCILSAIKSIALFALMGRNGILRFPISVK